MQLELLKPRINYALQDQHATLYPSPQSIRTLNRRTPSHLRPTTRQDELLANIHGSVIGSLVSHLRAARLNGSQPAHLAQSASLALAARAAPFRSVSTAHAHHDPGAPVATGVIVCTGMRIDGEHAMKTPHTSRHQPNWDVRQLLGRPYLRVDCRRTVFCHIEKTGTRRCR